MNYLKILFCVILLSFWNDSNADEIPGIGIVKSNGETAFFYLEEENIVGVKCKDYTNVRKTEERNDCIDSPLGILTKTSFLTFKDSLKNRLKLSMDFNSRTLEIYNNAQDIDTLELILEDQKRIKNKIAKRENFINEFGESDKILYELTALKNGLSMTEEKLEELTDLNSIREEIDGKIERILSEITGDTFVDYVYSEDSDTLAFNILTTFLRYTDYALRNNARLNLGNLDYYPPLENGEYMYAYPYWRY